MTNSTNTHVGFFRNWKKVCVTVSGYTLKWASTSETRSKWYAMKGATVAKTMQFRFQITNMTELRERESTGGSSYSGKEGVKRYRSNYHSPHPGYFSLFLPPSSLPSSLSAFLSSLSFHFSSLPLLSQIFRIVIFLTGLLLIPPFSLRNLLLNLHSRRC